MSHHTIAIVGPREVILGFKAIGVVPFFSENAELTAEIIKNLKTERSEGELKYPIIYILEEHARAISGEEYKKLTADPLPAIIALPGPQGSTGFGMQRIRQIVEKAIGSNILKE